MKKILFYLRHFSIRQLAIICVILAAVLLVWSLLSELNDELWYLGKARCATPDDVMRDIEELAIRSHYILNDLGVSHFLCFGSLWGAIRVGTTLPWDNNLDLCAVDENLAKVDMKTLRESFHRQAITVAYNYREGCYVLTYGKAVGYITVYRRFYTDMERTGWGRMLFPSLYARLHSFPARLVKEPYPTKKFHKDSFPVPHEDFELQKYLYPNDWWREQKPKGC